MFDFDPTGQVAALSLEQIEAMNTKHPDVLPQTAAMAFMVSCVEKAVLAKIPPMELVMALTMAWTLVSSLQTVIELANQVGGTPTAPEPPTPARPVEVVVMAKSPKRPQ